MGNKLILLTVFLLSFLSLYLLAADERDYNLITKMEGRKLAPTQKKLIYNNNECSIVQNNGTQTIFIPDKDSTEVKTLVEKFTSPDFTKSPCAIVASYGKSLEEAENLNYIPSSDFVAGDFLTVKVAGLSVNAVACNRRLHLESSGITSESADHCDASNLSTTNFRALNEMAEQNDKPLWTFNAPRKEWTLTKEVATTGLMNGGAIDFTFQDPTMGSGINIGTNAIKLYVQLTSGALNDGTPVVTCTPTPSSSTPDGIDNDCDGEIDEVRSVTSNRAISISGVVGEAYNCTPEDVGVPAGATITSSQISWLSRYKATNAYYDSACLGPPLDWTIISISHTTTQMSGIVPETGTIAPTIGGSATRTLSDSGDCVRVGSLWYNFVSLPNEWEQTKSCRYYFNVNYYD